MDTLNRNNEKNGAGPDDEIEYLTRKILDLNKQLIKSEKAKSCFLSLVTNMLNNPISALLGMIPHLKPDHDDKKEAICATVHEQVLILDFHVQNLVAAAEIENGKVDITHALVDLSEVVSEVLDALMYVLAEKNVRVHVENKIAGKIVSDPGRLFLMLRNLIFNGCSYGNANGVIDVVMEANGELLSIAVRNEGKGPEVEYKPQVFTRFATSPEGRHGMGLGLSIVRNLSELMDGNIDYETDENSVTFRLTLPLQSDLQDSEAYGSNEFLFESFDDAIEL